MTVAEPSAAPATAAGAASAAVADELRGALWADVERALALGQPTLVAATIEIDPRDPVGLFAVAHDLGLEPWLWHQPERGFALVAVGAARDILASGTERFVDIEVAWSSLLDHALTSGSAEPGTGPLLLGGLGFGPDRSTSSTWQGFEGAHLVLPRVLVTVSPEATWLSANILVTGTDQAEAEWTCIAEAWAQLDRSTAPPAAAGSDGDVLRISAYRPAAPEWRATVARFAGAVGRGRIDKVVLARQVDVLAPSTIDVSALVGRLAASAPESTIFALTRGGRTFVGATPERLVSLEGRDFKTVAMAGSTRRAADEQGDALLADELIESDKEREEHGVVVDMLGRTLAPIAESLVIAPRPSVLRLRHVQHLVTEVSGRLREPLGILALVSRLHPTPAVGGAPRELALELIADEEPHERGWYAGPLGWVDRNGDGEFVVALRSGVVEGSRATLFAGCGIVADSDPDREWDESLTKLRALGSALGRVEA